MADRQTALPTGTVTFLFTDIAPVRIGSTLDAAALSSAWAAGRRLTLGDAVAFALDRTAGPAVDAASE